MKYIGAKDTFSDTTSVQEDAYKKTRITWSKGVSNSDYLIGEGGYDQTIVPEASREIGKEYLVNVSINREEGGYAVLERTFETIKKIDKEVNEKGEDSKGKTTSSTMSVSLQQTSLIQHTMFKWMLTDNNTYTEKILAVVNLTFNEDGSPNFKTSEVEIGPFTLLKAVQQYIDIQQGNLQITDTTSQKLEKLEFILSTPSVGWGENSEYSKTKHSRSPFTYAKYILAGVDSFLSPQATFSTTKQVVIGNSGDNRVNSNVLFDENHDVGLKINTPSSIGDIEINNSEWDLIYSGAEINFEREQGVANATQTFIGLPKLLGGGWDNNIYGSHLSTAT